MTTDTEQRPEDLLAELDESIPQGVPNSTRFNLDEPDPFADLNALLTESVADRERAEQHKRDRELARKGFPGLSREEVEFCNSRMREWELAREWEVDRTLAVFQQFTCLQCGTAHVVFSRFMEHHQHRFVASTTRWVTVKETKAEQVESAIEDRPVPMCADCAPGMGVEVLTGDTPWLEDVLGIDLGEEGDGE